QADDLVRDLVTDDYGIVCMCSSLGSEYSLESPETEAGFFTKSVVEGMDGAADIDHDRIIYIHELDYYSTWRVRELSSGQQNPVTGRAAGVHSFPLGRPCPRGTGRTALSSLTRSLTRSQVLLGNARPRSSASRANAGERRRFPRVS